MRVVATGTPKYPPPPPPPPIRDSLDPETNYWTQFVPEEEHTPLSSATRETFDPSKGEVDGTRIGSHPSLNVLYYRQELSSS